LGIVLLAAVGAVSLLGHSTSNLVNSVQKPQVANSLDRMSHLDFGGGSATGSGAGLSNSGPNGVSSTDMLLTGTGGHSKNSTGSEGNLIGDEAKVLDAILAKIKADPNADPGIVALVTDLANNGHSTGSSLETALNNYDSNFPDQASFDKFNAAYTNFYQDRAHFSESMDTVNQYLAQHPQVLTSDLQQQIKDAYNSANSLANSIVGESSVYDENFKKLVADPHGSTLGIHKDSNTVCSSGGDTNACIQPVH
jgi:hypothetical protein